MKAIFEFNMDDIDDRDRHKLMLHAAKVESAIEDFHDQVRTIRKYTPNHALLVFCRERISDFEYAEVADEESFRLGIFFAQRLLLKELNDD